MRIEESNGAKKICKCKFKILIVDDSDFNLVILKQLLKKI